MKKRAAARRFGSQLSVDGIAQYGRQRFVGTCGKQLDEVLCSAIGQAYAVAMANRGLLLGHDGTFEARKICLWLSQGITTQAADVFYIGAVSLDEMRFAMTNLPYTGAMYVASNGLDLDQHIISYFSNDRSARSNDLTFASIARLAQRNSFLPCVRFGETKDFTGVLIKSFLSNLLETTSWNNKCNASIVISVGIETVSNIFRTLEQNRILEQIGIRLHWAIPSPKDPLKPIRTDNLVKCARRALKTTGFDFGVVFDNPHETPLFLDETGELVEQDVMMALIANNTARLFPNKNLVLAAESSSFINNMLRIDPERVVVTTVDGHVFQRQMLESHAQFGFMTPNRYFYAQLRGIESTVAPVLGAAHLVSRGLKLSQLVEDLEQNPAAKHSAGAGLR